METCLARGLRLAAVLIGLLAIVVGGYVTIWLLSSAWLVSYRDHSLVGGAMLTLAGLATPVGAAAGWRKGSTRAAFERFAIASSLALPVALVTGLLMLAWVLLQPAPY